MGAETPGDRCRRRRGRPSGSGTSSRRAEELGMATVAVWKFESGGGAGNALTLLERMQKEELVQIIDGATVSWPEGKKKPKTEQLHSTTGAGALGGSFWGLLCGLIFFVPLLGLAVGAAMGALSGSLRDVGIDDDFIRGVREHVTPGTSALFVMTGNVVLDKVAKELADS